MTAVSSCCCSVLIVDAKCLIHEVFQSRTGRNHDVAYVKFGAVKKLYSRGPSIATRRPHNRSLFREMQDILEVTKYETDQIFQVGPRSSSFFSVFLSRKFGEIIKYENYFTEESCSSSNQMHEGGRRKQERKKKIKKCETADSSSAAHEP